jgi:hypothetical protein
MKKTLSVLVMLICFVVAIIPVKAAVIGSDVLALYQEYEDRFESIIHVNQLEELGYAVDESQTFPVLLETFGQEEVIFISAMEENYNRVALFFTDKDGNVIYKCNRLETNYVYEGVMKQPTESIASVSFQDVNHDSRTDIILITKCVNDEGEYAGKSYKVGDVLFQGDKSFYRDWRISDKINRFSMNMNAKCIISFVKDNCTTEFLYTATTLEELLENGFEVIEEQCYSRNFEKLGRLQTVPGMFKMSEYNIFMIYLVDSQGNIVWSCQPMKDYDSLYSLKGTTGKDVDGDGMKDLVVLARYSDEGPDGKIEVKSDCSIYYQRTSGFDTDIGFHKFYTCTEEDTLEAIVTKIREYWGWKVEETDD